MPAEFDLVVRKGTILDGRGGAAFEGDVAISGGAIAAVGNVRGTGREELDAGGKLITPGFVDIHTHYDGQITWDSSLQPSSHHGVTTVVMGNCGVGFAPCKPDDRELLMHLMEGIEDIPLDTMRAGIPWTWQSFPDFLDALAVKHCEVDFAAQVPHGALRVFAMGQRAVDREPATTADVALMARLVREAVEAGALGFSTSRTLQHRTKAGSLCPTITASEDELGAIAMAMAGAGKGVIEFADDFHGAGEEHSAEFEMWERIGRRSGRPLSFALIQFPATPDTWRHLLAFTERANDGGVTIRPQVSSRAIGSLYGLDTSENPFTRTPSYRAIAGLPLAERVAAMRRPELRERIIAEAPAHPIPGNRIVANMFPFGDPPDYEPPRDASLAARAERRGHSVLEEAYDLLLERDGHSMLYYPAVNFVSGTLDASYEMMTHRDTLIGIGDGGAHLGRVCDASIPTHVLAYWTRDRRGARLPLEQAVRMLTSDTAQMYGLGDRGVIAPGMVGDLNVIDYDALRLHAPEVHHDLPAGGTRILQNAGGYVATVKSGTVTFRDGAATGALPGRLVRGARTAAAVSP